MIEIEKEYTSVFQRVRRTRRITWRWPRRGAWKSRRRPTTGPSLVDEIAVGQLVADATPLLRAVSSGLIGRNRDLVILALSAVDADRRHLLARVRLL